MKKARRVSAAYIWALFSGALLVAAFPPYDFFPLAWVALSPLLIILYDKTPAKAFRIGLAFGLVYFFGTVYWIYHSIHYYGSFHFIPSVALVAILSLYLGLYPAVFAYLYTSIIKRTEMPALLLAPLLWTSLEFIRSYALSGFPWASLGYSQHTFLAVIQSADITGIYGISFLIVAVNGAIADCTLLHRRQLERPLFSRLPSLIGLGVLALVVVANGLYGLYRLHQERPGEPLRVSVVQGSVAQDRKWDPAYQKSVIDTYKELTREAAKQRPSLIVWPETSVPFYFDSDADLTEDLISFQKELDTYLLFGSVLKKKETQNESYSNSTVLLARDGSVSFIYDKIHLVPFGEYVPLRRLLFFVNKLVVGVGDFIPGDSYLRAVTPFGSFGTPVCFEIIFPGLVRKFYLKGGDFMVTVTNDAWFGRTNGPYQHFSMAVFRAVENRKPVIRAANTGISGFIDSSGRVIRRTELFTREHATVDLRTDQSMSFYTRYGDLFSFVCIVLSLIFVIRYRQSRVF